MKYINFLTICLSIVSFSLISCGDSKKDLKDGARDSLVVPENVVAPIAAPIAGASVFHYICANNCAGSGGAAQANCPVCGNAYIHNQAFHNTPADGNTLPGPGAGTPPPTGAATNAAGVFHYTCNAGCAGGAGAAGNCGTCGGALAHNAAFHQ